MTPSHESDDSLKTKPSPETAKADTTKPLDEASLDTVAAGINPQPLPPMPRDRQ